MAEDRKDPRDWLRMLVRLKASEGVRFVANALVGYAAPKLTCNPRYATVASITGLGKSTVMAHVGTLERAHAILVHARHGSRGQQLPNEFEFVWPEDEAAARLVLGARRTWKLGGSAHSDPPPSEHVDPPGSAHKDPRGPRTQAEGSERADPIKHLSQREEAAAREPLPLHASGEEEEAASGHDCPEASGLTDAELARAVEHRVSEMRAAGTVTNEAGLRRVLTATFRDDSANGREVLARAARAAGPPVLTARASAYRARLLELADEAMGLGEHGTAEALRLVARRIRETGELPDETPEEVAEREREHRAALLAEEVA